MAYSAGDRIHCFGPVSEDVCDAWITKMEMSILSGRARHYEKVSEGRGYSVYLVIDE